MPHKFLPHTADIKFQASGETLEKAFSSSAEVLKEVITEKINIKEKIKKEISVQGKDHEALLYNFLEEFLFLLDSENFLLSKIKKIKITQDKTSQYKLIAEITGDKASKYKFTNNVKAVTYSQMFIKKQKDKYTCQVVLDV
ncbi:protein archease [Candidatus Pacearchaeota archaeon]|nr:protein archease [Candidatus Pacearchaeota archaeon]|tara:strand:- start:3323 stop:3745 length:423 start_codon:yes stop_codon:yes gene_type:complete